MQDITTVVFPNSRVRNGKMGANDVAVHYRTDKGKSRYCVTLNRTLSEQIIEAGFKYASLKINNYTDEYFLCFSNEPYGGIHLGRTGSGNSRNVVINHRLLIEHLIGALGLTFTDGMTLIKISDNLAKREDLITIKLSKQK